MDEFWQWMTENEYGEELNGRYILWGECGKTIEPNDQMLWGYQVEYLKKIGYRVNIDITYMQ